MGLIFDADAVSLYRSWTKSDQGRIVDRFVEESVKGLLDPQPGERVLDIGCGEGNHLLLFSKLGLDINGVDASPYTIEQARKRLGNRSTLKVATAEDLPFSDNEFDLAVLINTLEFLDDPLAALREAGRVAKRGVFIGVLNSLSWFFLSQKLQGLFKKSLFSQARFFSLWELKSYASEAFGDSNMTWNCSRIRPSLTRATPQDIDNFRKFGHIPIGLYLGACVSLRYWVKTEQHPLKIGLKKAKQTLASGISRNR
ncbi:MAG: class I SAM-dependent methyltransferase [Desulfatiglandales bacterium]